MCIDENYEPDSLSVSPPFRRLRTGVFGFASKTEAYFGVLEYAPVIVGIGLWAIFPLYKMLESRK